MNFYIYRLRDCEVLLRESTKESVCSNLGESQGIFAKWKKSDSKDFISFIWHSAKDKDMKLCLAEVQDREKMSLPEGQHGGIIWFVGFSVLC